MCLWVLSNKRKFKKTPNKRQIQVLCFWIKSNNLIVRFLNFIFRFQEDEIIAYLDCRWVTTETLMQNSYASSPEYDTTDDFDESLTVCELHHFFFLLHHVIILSFSFGKECLKQNIFLCNDNVLYTKYIFAFIFARAQNKCVIYSKYSEPPLNITQMQQDPNYNLLLTRYKDNDRIILNYKH